MMPCPLVLRVDGSPDIGTGHVMRMIALAQAWRRSGGQVIFLGALTESLRRRIEGEGFKVEPIESPHPEPGDLNQTLEIVGSLRTNQRTWIVLDGYHFDPTYQRGIKDAGHRLLVVDDDVHHKSYHADMILNQNIHATDLSYPTDPSTELLLGPRYILLREEFLPQPPEPRPSLHDPPRVLLTMGGGDPGGVTLQVLDVLQSGLRVPINLRVVIGGANPNRAQIEKEVASIDGATAQVDVNDMPALMRWADVAITAGGSTCWELCHMGVPSLIIATAENQVPIAEGLEAGGQARYLGWHEHVESQEIAEATIRMLQAPDVAAGISTRARDLVDGLGSERVVRRMRGENLLLRRVRRSDRALLWEWANDPVVREAAFSSGEIGWDEHCGWFSRKLEEPGTHIFIACEPEGGPVGQIRFEAGSEGPFAEIDVSISKAHRGKGLGSKLIETGVQRLFATTDYNEVHALVQPSNKGSIRAFTRAGFGHAGTAERQGQLAELYVRPRTQRNSRKDGGPRESNSAEGEGIGSP